MKIEFNLITRHESRLDDPTVWYGGLAILGLLLPAALMIWIASGISGVKAGSGEGKTLEARIKKLSSPAWDRKALDEFARRTSEATDIARRSSARPGLLLDRIIALVPAGIRITKIDLAGSPGGAKSLTGEALDRAALSELLARLDGAGRETISWFALKREDRTLTGEGEKLRVASRAEALAAGTAQIRFTVTFRLAREGA